MHFTKEELENLKIEAETEYRKIGEVRCPFLDEMVIFNSLGLEHISYKRRDLARNEEDQFTRFGLLHLAPQIIKKSHTLQGINAGNRIERVKVNDTWENRMVYITYYEFVSVV